MTVDKISSIHNQSEMSSQINEYKDNFIFQGSKNYLKFEKIHSGKLSATIRNFTLNSCENLKMNFLFKAAPGHVFTYNASIANKKKFPWDYKFNFGSTLSFTIKINKKINCERDNESLLNEISSNSNTNDNENRTNFRLKSQTSKNEQQQKHKNKPNTKKDKEKKDSKNIKINDFESKIS